MARELNNTYLSAIAGAVDPDGGGGVRQLNNDYLKRIAAGIGTMTSAIDPHTGDVDATRLDGVIPAANLPSYVDDVVDGYLYNGTFYEDAQHTEAMVGETGKIYLDLSTYDSYRWSGSIYARIGSPLEMATQTEAENGTDIAKYMSPLRTKQAIAAQVTGLTAQEIADIKAAM